jgi:hypothetical protein
MSAGRDALAGSWVHAHEEDQNGESVYRPASFELPPSRGRDAFELRADGTLLSRHPGPVDAPVEEEGTWELRGDELVLRHGGADEVLAVVSAEPDRLVVRRL